MMRVFLSFIIFAAAVARLPGTEVRWMTSLSDTTVVGIAVATDGSVKVAAEGGVIASFTEDGTRQWQVEAGFDIAGIALGDDGTLYASGTKVVALSATGEEKWRIAVGSQRASAPVWSGGALYLNTGADFQCKITPTGEVEWKTERIGDHGPWDSGAPFLTGEQNLIVASDATIHKLNSSGQGVWSYPMGDTIRRFPMLVRGNHLWIATAGSLHLLDHQTGSLLSRREGNYRFGPVALGDEMMVLKLNNGNVRCLDSVGEKVWETTHIEPGSACALVTDGSGNVFATSGANLHCLSADGKERWRLRIPHGPKVAVMTTPGRLYVGGIRGMFVAVDVD